MALGAITEPYIYIHGRHKETWSTVMKWSPREFSGTKRRATKEKVVSDSEPNIEYLSFSLSLGNYSFCKVKRTHSPSSSHHTDQTDNEEDDIIVDCVPRTQNIDLIHKSSGLMSLLSWLICLICGVNHLSSILTFSNACVCVKVVHHW